MSRPTPSVQLSENEKASLNTIMQNNPKETTLYKRAAVILACAEGKQGKDIAQQYLISPNMVINWRRKFENGGVEGLITDAPKPGKRVSNDVAEKETSNLSNAIREEIKQNNIQIVGLFLSLSVQILALVISPLTAKPLFAEGKRITVNTGSMQSQLQINDDNQSIDLASTLRCLPSLIPSDDAYPTKEEAINFIENLNDSLKNTKNKLHIVLNTQEPTIVTDQSIVGMQLSSTEEFKETASIWLKTLDENFSLSDIISKNIDRLLDSAPTNCKPFIWSVTPNYYQLQNLSAQKTMPTNRNTLTFNIAYKDNTGTTMTCSKVLVDAIPNSSDFSQCKTIHDFQRLAGELEQGILKGSQEIGNAFLNKTICSGSITSKKKEDLEKQRVIDLESMLGRTQCLLPDCIDTTLLSSRSRLFTPELSSLIIKLVEDMPYAKVVALLNSLQHREDNNQFNPVTLNNCIVRWGTQIHQEQLKQAKQALSEFGFDPETAILKPGVKLPSSITDPVISEEEESEVREKFTKILNEYLTKYPETPINVDEVVSSLECPKHTTILIIDDVGVKRQKETRSVNGKEGSKSAKTVINTVSWVCSHEGSYAIASENTRQGLLMSLGYMLKNGLLENRKLIIFFDGAKVIRIDVNEIFSFHKPLKVYLDWYHVCKRITENLSMALKCGKENRDVNQEYIKEILKKVWFNRIDNAIDILNSIDPSIIRNKSKINDTINYLNDRRPYLYNYAARKITGLINSSNRVEDANNHVVAKRQKNKSMAWSAQGSRGLAVTTTLSINNEAHIWISQGIVPFSPRSYNQERYVQAS